ncbi:NPC1-like intracellular cholesterol transporter 1 [Puma concolor]|uniref:NPC1-like intracellular cholesterol transporter 1 n=1 Tax=Puma concolor TaxID=9696 RepID=A0A6P6HSS1_PUMCO|nr:NPC1-like intracellular cholesterol transporter 1 [Puma concolor]
MAEAGLRGWLLWALLLHSAQAELYTPIHRSGYCAFYDECGKNPELSGGLAPLANVSCLSNTPARLLAGEHLALLRRICPRLYAGPDTTYACCSAKQLVSLEASLAVTKALLARCPACTDNFVSLHCHNTCSPNQSLFVNVTRVARRGDGRPPAVVAYEAFYQSSFARRTYDSCSRVRVPAAATLAVGTMCGVYGSALCNAQRWLNFQGDTGNGLAPLDITFYLLEPGQTPGSGVQLLNGEVAPCNESQADGTAACSCQDCAASCPAIAQPQALDATFYMGRMAGGLALVITLCSAFAVLTAFLVGPRLASHWGKGKMRDPTVGTSLSDKLSLSTHSLLSRCFQGWGTWVASWPLSILLVSIAVVVAFSGGLAFMELTTDPVELWSAPSSQARREKEFHDQHFGPFLRTNQVILTAPTRPGSSYNSLLLGPKNFSGVLAPDVLLEVLELQETLRHLQVWSPEEQRNVSLQDVCFAPLNPHNTSLSDCCVNSLLQYFQNNRTRLLLTANQTLTGQTSQVDWRDHFLYCANAPLTFKDGTALALSCMADYGGPVFPFLAVGGYRALRGFGRKEQAMQDSYLLDYFLFLNRYFEVGAPVYFVTTGGYNFSSEAGMNAICSSAGCDSFSLTQKIQFATEFPNESYLAIPASSWVDDFIDWLTPSSCCRLYAFGANKDKFCPSTVNSLACLKSCVNFTLGPVRPSVDQFHKYLPWFLEDPPNIKCPKGGLAAYSTSVDLGPGNQVLASRFMAYHKPLRNSQDYTEALRAARALAANITAHLRQVPGTDPAFEVFPYTITNVFYEQYLMVVPEGLFMLAMCLLPTFAVCCLLLGMDLRSGLLNLFSIVMILVDTVGFMALWGISYNAVSLINLVTAVGISVEFVSHITRAFAISTRLTRLERAKEATIFMGSAVFAGVAMTNLPGILVLGLAKAQLIQIFFFRLNLLITLLGLLHGLVFLPVVLSFVGPDVNVALVLEQKMEEAARARVASCPTHQAPTSTASSTYINHGFEHPAKSMGGAVGSLSRGGQEF